MRKLALITATAAIIASAGAFAVFAATPSNLDCQNATDPGNIGPKFKYEVNDNKIKVRARGAYGFSSRLDKKYRYAATGQGVTPWTDAKTHTWQLPESGLGKDYKVTVWACAIKKKQPLKGQHHVWVHVPAPPTPTPVPPTRTPTPSPTPTPTPEAQDGIKSPLFTYVGWSGRIDGRRAHIGCSEYDSTTQACPDDMPAPFMEQLRTAADQWDAVLDTENPVDLQILLTQNQTARAVLIADADGNPREGLPRPRGCLKRVCSRSSLPGVGKWPGMTPLKTGRHPRQVQVRSPPSAATYSAWQSRFSLRLLLGGITGFIPDARAPLVS